MRTLSVRRVVMLFLLFVLLCYGCTPPSSKPKPPAPPSVPPAVTARVPSEPGPNPPPQTNPQTNPRDGAVYVYVPAGEFLMGSADTLGEGPGFEPLDQMPEHNVFLDGYWIGRTEVTNAQFATFVAATGHETDAEKEGWGNAWTGKGSELWQQVNGANWRHPQGPSSRVEGLEAHPVVQVTWDDAITYCRWAGGRLPTEAEWEKAARGTDRRLYPWGQVFDVNRLNFCDKHCPWFWSDPDADDGYLLTAPVGTYPSGTSPYGVLDMAGNVEEWVADWYDASYYARSPYEGPSGPTSGDERVVRGGRWFSPWQEVTVAIRLARNPDFRDDTTGFRCAASPIGAEP